MTGVKNITKGVENAITNKFKFDYLGYLEISSISDLEIPDITVDSPIAIPSGKEAGFNTITNNSKIFVFGTLYCFNNLTLSANSNITLAANSILEFVR